jgi:hypothetical protein
MTVGRAFGRHFSAHGGQPRSVSVAAAHDRTRPSPDANTPVSRADRTFAPSPSRCVLQDNPAFPATGRSARRWRCPAGHGSAVVSYRHRRAPEMGRAESERPDFIRWEATPSVELLDGLATLHVTARRGFATRWSPRLSQGPRRDLVCAKRSARWCQIAPLPAMVTIQTQRRPRRELPAQSRPGTTKQNPMRYVSKSLASAQVCRGA